MLDSSCRTNGRFEQQRIRGYGRDSVARSLVVLEWRACSGWNQCRLLLLLLLRQRSALALRDGNGLRSAPSDIATRGRGRVAKPDKVMQQRSSWRRCGARRNVKRSATRCGL